MISKLFKAISELSKKRQKMRKNFMRRKDTVNLMTLKKSRKIRPRNKRKKKRRRKKRRRKKKRKRKKRRRKKMIQRRKKMKSRRKNDSK